jgi:hypothetical protein
VRGLMNSRAPIKELVSPSRASRAISAFLRCEQAEGDRCASARCLAGGRQLAAGPLGQPLCTKPVEKLVGGAQLVAGVNSTVLAAQPLAVHQLGPSQVERDTATAEARNRLLVEGFGARAGGQQGARAGLDPESPVGTTRLCPFDQTLKRHGGELVAAAPHGGFDQFGQRESVQTEPIVSGCQIGCGSGLLIPARPLNNTAREQSIMLNARPCPLAVASLRALSISGTASASAPRRREASVGSRSTERLRFAA